MISAAPSGQVEDEDLQMNGNDVITGESNVDELMTQYPATVSVFVHRRMLCPGCPAARFETLEEVCRIYHMPLQPLLAELRVAANREGTRA
jgi:hybrid cluster-associated redox disulfide protein